MAKKDELQRQSGGAIDMPDFLKTEGREGLEHVTQQDIAIPRIALAQGLSPQITHGKAEFIEGLSVGQMFNTITNQIYGRGPLDFTIIQAFPPRWVEFIPRDEGGGVRDPNVPAGDPRTEFGESGEPPIATKFYDFLIALLPLAENPIESVVALSFKSAMLKIGKQLNMLMVTRNKPPYAGVYTLSSVMTQNAKGTFAIYQVKNNGWVGDAGLYQALKNLHDSFQSLNVTIDRPEARGADGDTSFDPAAMGGDM
jgi:hypothetical protein